MNLNTYLSLTSLTNHIRKRNYSKAANLLDRLQSQPVFKREVRKIRGLGEYLNSLHQQVVFTRARRHFNSSYTHPNLASAVNKMNSFKKLYNTHQNTAHIRRSMAARTIQQAVRSRGMGALIENMMEQIRLGRGGANINATRYTAIEKKKLVAVLKELISNAKTLRNTAPSNERRGFFNNHLRAYARGLRAIKPLPRTIQGRYRVAPNTPNRATPAPAGTMNVSTMEALNNPHLVVRVPGVTQPFYMSPVTFTNLMRANARVNIPVTNVRPWLRMARNLFPNKTLFRHPINRNKNVAAKHIRFSRA
jgi:hypothetical protein